jgi:hypothetical protein
MNPERDNMYPIFDALKNPRFLELLLRTLLILAREVYYLYFLKYL